MEGKKAETKTIKGNRGRRKEKRGTEKEKEEIEEGKRERNGHLGVAGRTISEPWRKEREERDRKKWT